MVQQLGWDFNVLLTIFEQETGEKFFDAFQKHIADPLQLQDFRLRDGYYHLEPPEPFPAVVIPCYEPETSIGAKGELRDFALQLAPCGFVTIAVGSPGGDARQPDTRLQPLSYLGYVAANCCNALAAQPEVDPLRIGIVGHSYGGKWAMFGSCLYDNFACAA